MKSEILALVVLGQILSTSNAWSTPQASGVHRQIHDIRRRAASFRASSASTVLLAARDRQRRHDYVRDPADDAPVDIAAVDDLLARRLELRRKRLFDQADDVRDFLLERYGVYVDDGERTWSAAGGPGYRADGPRGRRGGGGRGGGWAAPPRRDGTYRISPASESLNDEEREYVEARLEARRRARSERDYRLADDIRDELRERLGVEIDDRLRQWSAGGTFDPNAAAATAAEWAGNRDFRAGEYRFRGAMSEDVDEDDLRAIRVMLSRRSKAKRAQDYDEADSIRDDLFREYCVRVDDRQRNWYFDMSAASPKAEVRRKVAKGVGQAVIAEDDRDGSPWNDDEIKIIPWGDDEEDDFDPENFDVLLDEDASNIYVAESYRKAPKSLELKEEDEVYVTKRIATRIEAAADGDYDTSSAIQTELLLCYGVHLDDKLGLWSAGGDFTIEPSDQTSDTSEFSSQPLDINIESQFKEDEESLKALTVPVLKDKLREKGLPVSGRKAELIERLLS